MKRTQIYLEADQDRRLAARATAGGVTKSILIREAVETYLSTPDEGEQLGRLGLEAEGPERALQVVVRACDEVRSQLRARARIRVSLTQTLPGMLTVIVGAVGGAIGALIALVCNVPPLGMVVAAIAGFAIVIALMWSWGRRAVTRHAPSLEPRFPSPR